MSLTKFLSVLALIAVSLNAANAEFSVTYQGSSIAAGGLGTLDVLIRSNAIEPWKDNLDSYSLHFRIADIVGSTPGGLQSANPQSDSQLADANYIFDGNSLGQDSGGPLGVVTTYSDPNDTYIGGDGTSTGF